MKSKVLLNIIFLPEVLAGDVSAEVPSDAFGADKSEDLCVIVIWELQVSGQESHGNTRCLKQECQAQDQGPFHSIQQ